MAEEAEVTNLHPLRVLPGGASAIPDEWYAAGILIGAFVLLWLAKRNLGSEAAHVHVGGAAGITFVAYYLIVTGLLRLSAATLAEKRGSTPITRAVAFFV